MNTLFSEMETAARSVLGGRRGQHSRLEVRRSLQLCYPGQTFDMTVPLAAANGRLTAKDLADLFITFLERLRSETTRKVFLIVDRLKAHEAKEVEAWIADHQDRLELFFLPRYAPERNPDEYLNNDLKGGINAAGLPENKEELRSRILGFMIKLLQLPRHVCSYFQHPCVHYAAGV